MTDQTITDTSVETDDHGAHGHPSDWAYIKIALILGVFTAIEVLTYFESAIPLFENNSITIATLMFLMVVKFYLVATWFMHLRFDNPIFGKLFLGGIILAVGVYVVALSAFEFWA
jgi:cytochrome c oxidase subunit 4